MYRTIFTFLLICVLGSCQSPSKSKQEVSSADSQQTLKVNIGVEPHTLDPRKARDLSVLTMMRMLFEGLTRVDANEEPQLAAAEQVSVSDDLLTYTFKLRKAVWSNGAPVLATDFEYAWKKILDPLFPSDTAIQLYVLKNAKKVKEGKLTSEELGVKALDAETLQVELEAPTPYFLELTAFPVFFPVNAKVDRENSQWAENASSYVSNGPFLLKAWKHYDVVELQKNKNYWDSSAVKLQEIQMYMVQEETEYKMFEKRELDWAGSPLSALPINALPLLKNEQALKSKPLLGTYFFRVNTTKPPFDKVAMRQAFAMAVNRDAICEHILHGNQLTATSLVPASMKLQDKPLIKDNAKVEARALFEQALKESGMKREDLAEITLTYCDAERNHLIAQAAQEQWFETFGIRVKLEILERKVYFDRLSKLNYSLATGSWIADFNDPVNFLEVFKYKNVGANNTGWENQEYISLLNASCTTIDPAVRRDMLKRSEKIMMDDMPLIPIFHFNMLFVNSDRVKNVVLSSMGSIDFKWASIDTSERQEIAKAENK